MPLSLTVINSTANVRGLNETPMRLQCFYNYFFHAFALKSVKACLS